jgi:MTH538 TIR-like domain (DUF1863)
MIRVHNIYVSHSWSEADFYDKLTRVLQAEPDFPYRLFGLPKADPVHASTVAYELRAAMRHPLSQCHVLVVKTGAYARYEKWIHEELELATSGYETRRRILAIDVFGPESKPTPLHQHADRVIPWSRAGIVTAIRELAALPPQRVETYIARAPASDNGDVRAAPHVPGAVALRRPATGLAPADASLRRATFGRVAGGAPARA